MLTLPHMRPRIAVVVVALGGLLVACQSPDVGQPCAFNNSIDSVASVPADYAATGVTVCENLVCIRSPTRAQPYCSKPCVANADCSQSETGLVCRDLTFDQSFFDSHPELKAQYQPFLGSLGVSKYCAVPLQ